MLPIKLERLSSSEKMLEDDSDIEKRQLEIRLLYSKAVQMIEGFLTSNRRD